jgi:transposase
MRNFLDTHERKNLISRHKKERDKRVCDRIKAVLLYDNGWNLEQIAEVLLLSDEAIRKHVLDYKSSQKLTVQNGGSNEKLSKEQSLALKRHLEEFTYLYVKDIKIYVEKAFAVEYSTPGLTQWLHRNGFSYKKPALIPGKANKFQQEEWIKEYEKLKQSLPKEENEYFDDFRDAVIGFLERVSDLDPLSELGLAFSSRVQDNFRAIGS